MHPRSNQEELPASLQHVQIYSTNDKSKKTGQVSLLKDDFSLFPHLYIVLQYRHGGMGTFFKHDNHTYPPSLSERGRKSSQLPVTLVLLATFLCMLIPRFSPVSSCYPGICPLLKDDFSLFPHLYIVLQYRHGGMGTFFKHDNHTYPPSLSERGRPRQREKFDLIDIVAPSIQVEFSSTFDVKLIDGAAVVHFLLVTSISTFDD